LFPNPLIKKLFPGTVPGMFLGIVKTFDQPCNCGVIHSSRINEWHTDMPLFSFRFSWTLPKWYSMASQYATHWGEWSEWRFNFYNAVSLVLIFLVATILSIWVGVWQSSVMHLLRFESDVLLMKHPTQI
jgi:hypothetical protein